MQIFNFPFHLLFFSHIFSLNHLQFILENKYSFLEFV